MDNVIRGYLDVIGGLRPDRRQDAIRHGTALTTIKNILAFDLGCVLAGMCGIGSHTRLLIHDGPREGEAATAQWMQSLCEPGNEWFQYIVTTADAPDTYSKDHAAVADVLHRRSPTGCCCENDFESIT